jgi:hypothetical protein
VSSSRPAPYLISGWVPVPKGNSYPIRTPDDNGENWLGFGQRKSFAHGGAINPADRPSFSVGFFVRADHAHLVGEKRRSADGYR